MRDKKLVSITLPRALLKPVEEVKATRKREGIALRRSLRTAVGERKGPETQEPKVVGEARDLFTQSLLRTLRDPRGLGQGIGLMSLILLQFIGVVMRGEILFIPVEFLGIGLGMRKRIRSQKLTLGRFRV